MSKPNYRQLRAEIQDLSRARGRARKAPERRDDDWRDFYDEDATDDGLLLEDDETEFLEEEFTGLPASHRLATYHGERAPYAGLA